MEANSRENRSQASRTGPEKYAIREKRMRDAAELKKPDRIPIMLPLSYMLAEMGGISKQALHDDPERAQELLEKAALEFQPDALFGPFPPDPAPHLILGDRMGLFPGHGVDPYSGYQFAEQEFMKAEDYDAFIEDPADWAVRVYLPRAFKNLEGFSLLPPLGLFVFGSYNVLNLAAFNAPPLAASFQAFAKAVQAAADVLATTIKHGQRMKALGFTSGFVASSVAFEAPFDMMSDTLRGMRGIMLDIFKRPDKLLAAEEKVYRFQMEYALSMSRVAGIKSCFIPLHRGSDGFMSIAQFEKFYWPQLKRAILELVENGITPYIFYEGAWDRRLEYLAGLPRGKTVGWFQTSDIFKVKEVVGDTMCIVGGMPNSLLASGTAEEVREYTRKLCQVVGKNGGFIMCTGVGEMSGSKPELVKAWVEATRQYGAY